MHVKCVSHLSNLQRLPRKSEISFISIQLKVFDQLIIYQMFNFSLQLEQRQTTSPYKPPLQGERDLEHFDPQFTNEPVQLTVDDQ